MKILMLGWELPPYNSGGLGVACYKLCKALAGRGVQIDFAVPYTEPHPQINFMRVVPALPYAVAALREAGGGAYDSHLWQTTEAKGLGAVPASLRGQQLEYAAAVAQIVRDGNYDMIHAHDWLTYDAAMAARPHTHVPIIAHVHATEFDRSGEFGGNPLVHEVEYQGLLLADHIVAVSQFTKDLLVRGYRLPPEKIEVIHNSIDPEDFTPVSTLNAYAYLRHMKQRGYKVVLTTNRFTVQKGFTYFLRAAQLAIQKEPKLLFVLCGSGEQYHELVALAAELGIAQNVIFTGFVRGKALRDAYEMADMFVMSSVTEPFGISALEAVGYGNVTLTTRQSGVREVVKNLLVYDYWDTARLADYLVAVAHHPSLPETVRANARAEFGRLSWQAVAEKLQNYYHKVAAAGAPA